MFQRNDNYVKLKKVTADDWEGVVELELGAGQEDLVTSNLYSFAEAPFDPDPVYAGKRVVGFLMYNVQKTKGKAKEASIYRFMIPCSYARSMASPCLVC